MFLNPIFVCNYALVFFICIIKATVSSLNNVRCMLDTDNVLLSRGVSGYALNRVHTARARTSVERLKYVLGNYCIIAPCEPCTSCRLVSSLLQSCLYVLSLDK